MTWAAVLWDLDGTLVDTEPVWMAGEQAIASAHGADWTDADGLAQVGNPLLVTGEYLRTRIDTALTAAQIVDQLVTHVASSLSDAVPWRPGARDLINAYATAGIPQAVVTMSYAPIANAVMRHLPFDVVITGDVVTYGKPHPEPYLTAAARLGVDPARCLAIEDSPKGAASANAAGCRVLAVPHFVDVPDAPDRRAVRSLDGMTPTGILALFH